MSKLKFVLDVDGVLSTGQFIYAPEGKVFKIFGPHDSDGLKILSDHLDIYFITADKRGFPISEKRVTDMGYPINLVSEDDRYTYVEKNFGFEHLIFMGDGLYDVPVLKKSFFGIAPNNARPEAKEVADFVTGTNAGEGAVCDACLLIKEKFFQEREAHS